MPMMTAACGDDDEPTQLHYYTSILYISLSAYLLIILSTKRTIKDCIQRYYLQLVTIITIISYDSFSTIIYIN